MSYGILVIEDEVILGRNIQRYLEKKTHEVRVALDGKSGLEQLADFGPEVVILDYQLPGMNGIEVLREILRTDPHVKVIMVTAHGSVELAIEAIKMGAFDYLNKPLVLSELKLIINKAVGQDRLEGTLDYYRSRQASKSGLGAIMGQSAQMVELRAQISRVVDAESALHGGAAPAALITGETGTGKELIARALHFESARRNGPFVELNCSALPEHLVEAELFGHERGAFTDAKDRKIGLVEAASSGTLFLDEIGELTVNVQAKLLKLLEDRSVRRIGAVRERSVDVRIVAATNRDLEHMVASDRFRSDLYFRLRTITLTAAPLRERHSDILPLADHFLALHSARYGRKVLQFSPGARHAMMAHHWPGNVRELRNAVERAVMLAAGDRIHSEDLALVGQSFHAPSDSAYGVPSQDLWQLPAEGFNLEELELKLVIQALERADWNVTQAARLLGLTRDTLRYRIEKYGLRNAKSSSVA